MDWICIDVKDMVNQIWSPTLYNLRLCSNRFDPPSGNLSSVKAHKGKSRFVCCLLDLGIRWTEDDLDVARMTLVRVDTPMSTICSSTSFLIEESFSYQLCISLLWRRTGACSTTMFLMYKSSRSMFLASAFDSAFLSRRVMNLIDFSGQRPV